VSWVRISTTQHSGKTFFQSGMMIKTRNGSTLYV
jgi:hypothetical protein